MSGGVLLSPPPPAGVPLSAGGAGAGGSPKTTYGVSAEEILKVINDYQIKWRETHKGVEFYFDRMLFRIDLSIRRKNVWKINPIYLIRKKDRSIKTSMQKNSVSVYANEVVAHAFYVKYWKNHEDTYPEAGRVIDTFTICHSFDTSSNEKFTKMDKYKYKSEYIFLLTLLLTIH